MKNSTWVEHDKKVKPYHRGHFWLGLGQTATSLLFVALLLWKSPAASRNSFLDWYITFLEWGGLFYVVGLPWSVLGQKWEIKFQLSQQTWKSWWGDQLKAMGVGWVLGSLVLGGLWFCLNLGQDQWWLALSCFLIFFSIVLAQLAPVLLIPLFMPMKPLEENDLKKQLLEMCAAKSVKVKDVYELGMSAKTEKGNAAFMGLGATKRIVLGDTFYKKFPAEQVKAVFAHELGHQVGNHLWKGLFVGAASMFFSFWLTNWICSHGLWAWAEVSWDSPKGLLIFGIVLTIIQKPLAVMQAMMSRMFEREADQFAIQHFSLGTSLAGALESLVIQNYGLYYPNPLKEFLFHSHPAPWRRIGKLTR